MYWLGRWRSAGRTGLCRGREVEGAGWAGLDGVLSAKKQSAAVCLSFLLELFFVDLPPPLLMPGLSWSRQEGQSHLLLLLNLSTSTPEQRSCHQMSHVSQLIAGFPTSLEHLPHLSVMMRVSSLPQEGAGDLVPTESALSQTVRT